MVNIKLFKNSGPDSVNRRIFRAALVVGVLGVVAKAASVLKELTIANAFGRSDSFDAYLIAFLLPSFVVVIVGNTVGVALVPVFLEVRKKEGLESAERLLSTVTFVGAVILCLVSLIAAILAPFYLPYMAQGFSPQKILLTRKLLYLLAPWVIFSGTGQIITYVLNAGERFALPALVPVVTPLIVIALVTSMAARWGAFVLAAGSLVGSILEALFLVLLLQAHHMRLRFHWNGFDANVGSVFRQCVPLFAGAFLMASTPVVNQSVAAMLPAGSVSALGYGNRIINAITTLGAVTLSTATFPYFSKMAADHDWAGCRHTLKRYSALLIATTVPFTFLFIAFSRPLIRVLYQRGAFTASDTEIVALVQSVFAIQIPFLMLCALLVRFLSAIRRNDLLLYGSAINLAVNIVLNLTFVKIWGVVGVALASSLVFVVSFAFLTATTLFLLARTDSPSLGIAQIGQAGK